MMNGSQETFNKMTSDSDLWEGDESSSRQLHSPEQTSVFLMHNIGKRGLYNLNSVCIWSRLMLGCSAGAT